MQFYNGKKSSGKYISVLFSGGIASDTTSQLCLNAKHCSNMRWGRRVQLALAASLVFAAADIWWHLSSKKTAKLLLDNPSVASTDKLSTSAESAEEILKKVTERQEARKQRLKNYCRQHTGQTLPWNKPQELKSFLVDDNYTFIYCAVPKVASTSWKVALLSLRNINATKSLNLSAVHHAEHWRLLSQYNPTDLSNRTATHFKFVFVREPFHRLLSGYKDKFIKIENRDPYKEHRRMIVKAVRPQDEKVAHRDNNNITFTEFLKFILTKSHPLTRDPHWRPIQELCFPCAFDFDFIGHFETLEEDATYILNKEQFNNRVAIQSSNPTSAFSDFMRFYSQVPREVIYRVGEAFRDDFEMFGYPFPGPMKSLLGH